MDVELGAWKTRGVERRRRWDLEEKLRIVAEAEAPTCGQASRRIVQRRAQPSCPAQELALFGRN
jgi:hypothetical protein